VAFSDAAREWLGKRRLRLELRARMRVAVRSFIRNNDVGLTAMAAVIGIGVGFAVAVVQILLGELRLLLFGASFASHLTAVNGIAAWRIAIVPALGGLAYGLVAWLLRLWRPGDIVDAIEANALHGGRMSLTDSLRLTLLTLLSAGVGASVGLEAAYTQLGSGIASRIGRTLRLRRADLRLFVGCGAAAAIAAAFNAPLAGAFYAFELIIGGYALPALAPVALAALAGALVERELFGGEPIFLVATHATLLDADYVVLALLGIASAGLGILAMQGVTLVEAWTRRLAIPAWLRPGLGGLLLGAMALYEPEVLGSGHGGIVETMSADRSVLLLLLLLVAKLVASVVSIGSGFRGGMFSSSLFLGSLFGSVFGALAAGLPFVSDDRTIYVLAGMGAVAAAIVGAPVTMILLVLEATADFSATIGVTVAVIIASFTVRHWFGYSFATWRFHVRGVPLRGAYDVGWLQDLTVARVMRRDVVTAPLHLTLRQLRGVFQVGGAKYVFALDEGGSYAGIIDMHEAHSSDLDPRDEELHAGDLARGATHFLEPGQPVRLALDLFVAADAEILAVLSGPADRRLLGYLTEAYALRRYNRELEQRRREELGEDEIFGPTRGPTPPVAS
jgi:CIC family chloride channel protein